MPANFVHLRLHSAYSLAESTLRIKSLSGLIADDHQPAAAITDTNNMFGALEFAQTLIGAGIQPIMGTQLNLEDAQGQGEIVLLAQTDLGYTNLSKLLSKTLLDADAVHDPSCSLDDLEAHAEGLILLSGGALAGFVGAPAGDGRPTLAAARADRLAAIFGDRFYIELQRHGLGIERTAEPHLLEIADRLNLPLVATNDCRFEDAAMSQPHDTLVCIGTGRKFSETNRPRFSPEHYFKMLLKCLNYFKIFLKQFQTHW